MQPFLNITTPLKIKTFAIVDYGIVVNSELSIQIKLFVQKIGTYIENFCLVIYDDKLRSELFDIIIDFCEHIKFIHLYEIDLTNIPQLSKIFKINNYLKYLTLGIKIKDEYNSSIILKEVSKSLPLSLHYLDLTLVINPDSLQIAFENCKKVELKKLLIRNWNENNVDTTLEVIRDFVKEKNLEFLSYSIADHLSAAVVDLEGLIEETQSFVKMMNYYDLTINLFEIY